MVQVQMKNFKTGIIALSVATMLSSCGANDKAAPGQVLAKVNDGEVTVMQLNGILRNAGPEGEQASGKQAALDFLIDQELLQQKAVAMKLDREPGVLQEIEQAKRQILAKAAMEKLIAKPMRPGESDIARFYQSNPQLFSQRAVYDITIFNLPFKQLPVAIKRRVDNSHSSTETSALFKSNNIKFEERQSSIAAEQLPNTLLDTLFRMKVGDTVLRSEGDHVLLVQLDKLEAMPVNLEESRERIQTYMIQKNLQDQEKSKLVELRKSANISFLKKFTEDIPPGANKDEQPVSGLSNNSVNAGLKGIN